MIRKKKIIVGFIVIIVTSAVIINWYLKSKKTENVDGIPKGAISVETEKVHLETIISTVKADGEIKFKDSSMLYASSQAKIKNVPVAVGDKVEKGQILIEYDKDALDNLKNELNTAQINLKSAKANLEVIQIPAEESELKQHQIQIEQAENSIKESQYKIEQLDISKIQAQNNLDTAKKDYENSSKLYSQGIITKSELDKNNNILNEMENNLKTVESQYEAELLSIETAKSSLELAQVQYNSLNNKVNHQTTQKQISVQKIEIEQAELKIKQLQDEINKFKLQETAPVSGIIVMCNAEEGENVVAGKAFMEIADIDNTIISIDIPEYDMSEIELGQEATITGDAIAEEFKGTITKIYPIAEEKNINGSNKTVVTVEITANTNQVLKSGYTVEAEVTTKISENVVVIPIMAYITEKNASPYVYVVKEDYTIEKRDVKLKAYSDLNVEVEGINEGEIVVSTPNEFLSEGVYVRPLNTETNTEISTDAESDVTTDGEV